MKSFLQLARELLVVLHAAEFRLDHAHIFLSDRKKYSTPYVAQRFKCASSRRLRQHVRNRIAKYMDTYAFWACGHSYVIVGSVTARAKEFYLRRCPGRPSKAMGKD